MTHLISTMTHYFCCAYLDFECEWEAYGDTIEELVKYVEEHLIDEHHYRELSANQRTLIRKSIEEIDESNEDGEDDEDDDSDEDDDFDEWDDETG